MKQLKINHLSKTVEDEKSSVDSTIVVADAKKQNDTDKNDQEYHNVNVEINESIGRKNIEEDITEHTRRAGAKFHESANQYRNDHVSRTKDRRRKTSRVN